MSDVKVVNQVSDEDVAAAAAAFSQEKEQETARESITYAVVRSVP